MFVKKNFLPPAPGEDDKNGDKVGDSDSMEYALSKTNRVSGTEQELQVNIANGLVIHCFRLLVKKGKINRRDILFYNKATDINLSEPIRIDSKGNLETYPLGFLDTYSDILSKLL